MQEICSNLANTGADVMFYVAIAFGFIILASLTLYFIKGGGIASRGFFALVLFFGFLASLTVVPVAEVFAGGTDCNDTVQGSNNNGNDNNGGNPPVTVVCSEDWVVVPGNDYYGTDDFCLMKYHAKDDGGNPVSQAAGEPWVNISQTDALTVAQTAGAGAHLITEDEWMTVAHNILVQPENWCDSDGSDCGFAPGTAGKVVTSGHTDGTPGVSLAASTDDSQACFGTVIAGTDSPCGSVPGTQKRTHVLSNGEVVWDLAGNVLHWTAGIDTRGNIPSFASSGGSFEYNLDTGFGLDVPDNWGNLGYINPAIFNPAAANWGRAHGIGALGSYYTSGSTDETAFFRGGYWAHGMDAGIFSLGLGDSPTAADSTAGFRVTSPVQ